MPQLLLILLEGSRKQVIDDGVVLQDLFVGDRAEFLLLGFSSNKEAMRETYDMRLGEKEMIGGRETYLLELTPKSEKVSAYFSQIVLWIDVELWVPIQQKLVEPTRDYLLIRFDDIDLNPKITKSRFELKIGDDVQIVGS